MIAVVILLRVKLKQRDKDCRGEVRNMLMQLETVLRPVITMTATLEPESIHTYIWKKESAASLK